MKQGGKKEVLLHKLEWVKIFPFMNFHWLVAVSNQTPGWLAKYVDAI